MGSVEYWFDDVFSLRGDVRGALSARDIDGYAIRGLIVSVTPGVCASVRWFSGCLLGTTGAFERSTRQPPLSFWRPFVGFGAGASATVASIGPFALRFALDGTVLADDYALELGGSRGAETIWAGPQFLGSLSMMMVVPIGPAR